MRLHCCDVGSRWFLISDTGLGDGTFCLILLKEAEQIIFRVLEGSLFSILGV